MSYAAEELTKRITEAGQPVSQHGDVVTAGRHQIHVSSYIENEVHRDGRWMIGVGVQVALDGKILPAMRSGAVGIDTSREAALRTAAEEWCQEFGVVMVEALFPRPTDSKPMKAGPYHLFSSLVGMRGQGDIQSFDTARKQLPEVVGAFVSRTFAQPTDWHGMAVTVVIDPRQGRSSMCQVDGKPSNELNLAIQSVAWPATTTCMFKQFFLAVPAR